MFVVKRMGSNPGPRPGQRQEGDAVLMLHLAGDVGQEQLDRTGQVGLTTGLFG